MARKKTAKRKTRDSIARFDARKSRVQFLTHAQNNRTWCSEYATQWTRENDVPLGYGQSFINPRSRIMTAKTRKAKPEYMRAGEVTS